MLNETRQNISTKETLLFCTLGGVFVYFVCALPRIYYYFFPIQHTGTIDITIYVAPPPDIYPFIVGFSLFTILGIYFLNKLNFKNRLVHFSLLGLILAFGGGILTGVLENSYYLFWLGDSIDQEIFFHGLQENWLTTLFYTFKMAWSIIFLLILTPFTIIFLTSTSIIKRFANRNSLS